jgi:hypothetical protein
MDFNADDFMNTSIESAMPTSLPPVPEGEYLARVGSEQTDVSVEAIQGKKDPSKTYVRLTIWWDVIDEVLKATLGREKVRVRDQFLLDVDPISRQLLSGEDKNVALGARRAALGLNEPGVAFNFNMLRGRGPAKIRVRQTSLESDPSVKFSEVARVAPVA